MTDIDLLGPGAAGAARTLTTTTDVSNPDAADTFFQDCVANTPGTGTPYMAKWANKLLQQVRRVIRFAGVPLSNSDDDMLGQAIQSGALNWAGSFGGTAGAVTATLQPVPPALSPGMQVFGRAAFNCPGGAMTFNAGGLGAVALVDWDGGNFSAGDFLAGVTLRLVYDGTVWRARPAYLPLTGGTVSGQITLTDPVGDQLVFNAAAGVSRAVVVQTAGNSRWRLALGSNDAEGGANSGTNVNLFSFNDAGSLLATVLSIARATGIASFWKAPVVGSVGGGNPLLQIAAAVTGGSLIMQCDTTTLSVGDYSNVTFPQAFPNGCLHVFAEIQHSGAYTAGNVYSTHTGDYAAGTAKIGVSGSGAAGPFVVHYFALGY